MTTGEAVSPLGATRRSDAQLRIMDATLKLFSKHGVSGTSFQMIADALGVSKAAVYKQFNAKNDLVIAVSERELAMLEDSLAAAEAQGDAVRGRDVLLDRVIGLAVENRGLVGTLQFDPVIVRVLSEHEPFQRFTKRLFGVLLGNGGDAALVPTVMSAGAIAVAVMHPSLSHMDNDELARQIRTTARRIMDLPDHS
jgi:AcrR family transcriptional regulator